MDTLTFLGTGDAMGVPRVYCDCGVCTEARSFGNNRRLRSSVMVEDGQNRFMIDCGPDWRNMMETNGIRQVNHMLITHAHFDHIGGLPEWSDACRWLRVKGSLYAPREVLEQIQRQYPWLSNHMIITEVDDGITLCGWDISCWKVNHGKNGYSHAYRLEKNGFSWVYNSDSINLNDKEKKPLYGLDLLVLGTSFVHETAEFSTRSVYDMKEAAELLAEVKPQKAIYTHMSHDVDVNQQIDLPPGTVLAAAGRSLKLSR
ncbi:phosphoribosyl 1,2-cyclic phosphate phosphodiesterase [Paenibacillus uliginis N3/975]|uniref:Phosphoribosyl 1,2-cyclic phosphate phosphodiesterase n=1 Tax=Paenibacillus uliginis N3/975 TaxID=1313296 RepID=A0A1X7GT50_9BACL|nr:MBL fold metallo-hydrolase [Paenibacillus uliginis]SMF74213.1 phosphoribosyl 1,2-cyclic phosphate phosphodiesterase [Paenibacillus uliginis N3/975]